MIATTYAYTLLLNGEYISLFSEDTVMSVLSEHPGAQFISRNAVGYRMITAD